MKKSLLTLLLVLLICGNSFAQLDPDDDGIGVYFNPCACNNCITFDTGAHTAFLVITHPTSPLGVAGWECKMWIDGPALITGVDLQGQEINIGTAPEYIVGTVDPLVNPFTYPAIVVAVINFFILDTNSPATFWIEGVRFHSLPDKVPAYLDGADIEIIKELRQSTGGDDFPVATVNGDCAVATAPATWGGVKALFR